MAAFKVRVLQIVSDKSKEYERDRMGPVGVGESNISNKMLDEGWKYSQTKKLFVRKENEKVICYMRSADSEEDLTQADVNEFLSQNWRTFGEFADHMFDLYRIEVEDSNEKWRHGTCTCPSFSNNFVCKHLVCIAYKSGLLKKPVVHLLESNSKRGRPKKAPKGGLSKE